MRFPNSFAMCCPADFETADQYGRTMLHFQASSSRQALQKSSLLDTMSALLELSSVR